MHRNVLISIFAVIALGAAFLIRGAGSDSEWPVTNAPKPGNAVVAFGESLRGKSGGVSEGDFYVTKLSKILGKPVRDLTRPEETTTQALARVEEALLAHPDVVVMALGLGDLRQGLPLHETILSLETLVTRLQAAGTMVVLVVSEPPKTGDNWMMAIKDVAKRKGVLLVSGVLDGLWGEGTWTADDFHPDPRGHERIATRIGEALESHLTTH